MVGGQHVGRFGHEVHAAEHDVGRAVVVSGEPGELEGVADRVGPTDHLVPLVVVTEDHQSVSERVLRGRDARGELCIRPICSAVGRVWDWPMTASQTLSRPT